MKKKRNTLSSDKFIGSQAALTGILFCVLLAAIALMLWNMSGLNWEIRKSTTEYVKDVSKRWNSDIKARFDTYELALGLVADSVPRLVDDKVEAEFLERKSKILEFDKLFTISREGKLVPENIKLKDLENLEGIRASFEGENAVIYMEGESILFSVPIYEEGKVTEVLAGLRSKSNIQALIQSRSFRGKSLACIIDSGGNVIVSPTDSKPFMQLDDIFEAGTDEKTRKNILKMKEDIQTGKADVFSFTASDGTKLLLYYQALGINDWVLLNLVPANLISGETDTYVYVTLWIVGLIVVLFSVFFMNLFYFFRKSRDELEKIAFCDPLTGGMNNNAFQAEYRKLVSQSGYYPHAVVLLNVKGFKLINENFGIQAGNNALKHIQHVLERYTRDGELAARGETDSFFLYLKERDTKEIQRRLSLIVRELNHYTLERDNHYYLEMRQGACIVKRAGTDIAILQDRARMACRTQKAEKECVFYSDDLIEDLKRERELNALLEDSLKNQDFQIFLQPKISLKEDRIFGAEALVRWIHPQKGMIFPLEFIPVFEKSGNICQLDFYVFEKSCRLLRAWMDEGIPVVPISVNLSRAHVKKPEFLDEFIAVKNKYHIPDGLIELELTESIFFEEEQRKAVENIIARMHENGFLCSLDDFGVGFSSMALLKEFNVDTIKLDRQFFDDIVDRKSRSIIEAFLKLGKDLGIHIVAEGIETEEQLAYLRSVKCDIVQGYIFSKPLPVTEFEQWKKERGE